MKINWIQMSIIFEKPAVILKLKFIFKSVWVINRCSILDTNYTVKKIKIKYSTPTFSKNLWITQDAISLNLHPYDYEEAS